MDWVHGTYKISVISSEAKFLFLFLGLTFRDLSLGLDFGLGGLGLVNGNGL